MERMTVRIKMHPLAWAVLRRDYAYDGRAVDVGHSWVYGMVVQGLERREVLMGSDIRRQAKNLVEGAVYITMDDYTHRGGYMRLSRQANISRAIYRQEMATLCHLTAVVYIATGAGRSRVMQQIMIERGINDEELNLETLKKHYQRRWRHKEEDIIKIIKELK